ncbi:MAG: hypothetical protein VX219_07180 [Actinomycetota bacterium]|nr:hypothetical protein [Actinomycetota bacterium]
MTTIETPRRGRCHKRVVPVARRGKNRTLHLVDIENLVGEPVAWTDKNVEAVFFEYLQEANWQPGDSLVVASNPGLMGRLAFKLSAIPHRSLCATGPDAADNLLINAVPAEIADRYGRIVVGSGDHAFTQLLTGLQGHASTLVVYGVGHISWELYRSAEHVIRLPSGQTTRSVRPPGTTASQQGSQVAVASRSAGPPVGVPDPRHPGRRLAA